MAMTTAAQGGVLSLALRIVLHSDPRPMVHGVGEPVMAGLPPDDDAALAGALGHGRDSCKAAQGGVIAPQQGIPSLCKQRGEDDPSHSRQGCEDFHVMLLLLPGFRILCGDEPGCQRIEVALGFLDLVVYQADACNERLGMGAGRFNGSGGNLHRRRTQHSYHMAGGEAPDTMALQYLGGCRLADTGRFARRWRSFPQIEEPLGAKVAFQFQHGGKIAPKLLPKPVGEAVALGAKVLGNPRPLPQFGDDRIGRRQQPEAARIGTQGRGHDLGVAAVILRARQGEAVAEAIHLFRIDGVHRKAALDQRLDHRAMRHFDGNLHMSWLFGLARCHEPGRHLRQARTAMLEDFLADFAATTVCQKHMMALSRPIDAGVPLLSVHPFSPPEIGSRRHHCRSLYWRSESKSQVRRGLPTGHRLRPIQRGAHPAQVIKSQGPIGCSCWTGSVREGYADLRRRRAQIRESVSQALDRVRKAARQRKKEKFTALLHHISPKTLEVAFYALKRKAAPGVDGVTWQEYEADLERRLIDLHGR